MSSPESHHTEGMLEDPGLSRQWILRRLQRALSTDRLGAALRFALKRGIGTSLREGLQRHAEATAQRTVVLEGLIRQLGGEPYFSLGVSTTLARGAGWITGVFGGRGLSLTIVQRLAHHSLAEYEALIGVIGRCGRNPERGRRPDPPAASTDHR